MFCSRLPLKYQLRYNRSINLYQSIHYSCYPQHNKGKQSSYTPPATTKQYRQHVSPPPSSQSLYNKLTHAITSQYQLYWQRIDQQIQCITQKQRMDQYKSYTLLVVITSTITFIYTIYGYGTDRMVQWVNNHCVLSLDNIMQYRYYTAYTFVFTHYNTQHYLTNTTLFTLFSILIIPHLSYRQYRNALLLVWLLPCTVILVQALCQLHKLQQNNTIDSSNVHVLHRGFSSIVSSTMILNTLLRRTVISIIISVVVVEHTLTALYNQATNKLPVNRTNHAGHLRGILIGVIYYFMLSNDAQLQQQSIVYSNKTLHIIRCVVVSIGLTVLGYCVYNELKPPTSSTVD